MIVVLHRISCVAVVLVAFACALRSQQVSPGGRIQPGTPASSENKNPTQPESKRIFGIIPNYRTSPSLKDFEPLTRGEKFKIAFEDASDRGTFVLAALFAGEGQLTTAIGPSGKVPQDTASTWVRLMAISRSAIT